MFESKYSFPGISPSMKWSDSTDREGPGWDEISGSFISIRDSRVIEKGSIMLNR